MTVHFNHRIRQILTTLLVIWSILFSAILAHAQATDTEQEIRQTLIERDAEIKALLDKSDSDKARREELKAVINGIIDFRAMGRLALGDHWGELSEAQQDSFVTTFGQIVRNQSISNLDIYRSRISYDAVEATDDQATVTTSTVYKDVPATVVYLLHRNEETGNEWVAHDFILDDVSTAEGYARSFQSVIRKRGFDSLMTSLEKKRKQMEEKQ